MLFRLGVLLGCLAGVSMLACGGRASGDALDAAGSDAGTDSGADASPYVPCHGQGAVAWHSIRPPPVQQPRRYWHTAVWTGSEVIVWGGTYTSEGWRYDVAKGTWKPVGKAVPAMTARCKHAAVWTGKEMIVWGGGNPQGDQKTGAIYDPMKGVWASISADGAPQETVWHSMVWTGKYAVVWGGGPTGQSGGRYLAAQDKWLPVSTQGAPAPRHDHTAVWTGKRMIVFGGSTGQGPTWKLLGDGGAYDPEADTWEPLPTECAPLPRQFHTATWVGSGMFVWGGEVDKSEPPGESGAILVTPP